MSQLAEQSRGYQTESSFWRQYQCGRPCGSNTTHVSVFVVAFGVLPLARQLRIVSDARQVGGGGVRRAALGDGLDELGAESDDEAQGAVEHSAVPQ